MAVISLSEIQKNIGLLSNIKEPLKIRDKRKNINIATVYPISKTGKKSILDIGGSLKPSKSISKKSKDMSFSEIKKEATSIYLSKKKK